MNAKTALRVPPIIPRCENQTLSREVARPTASAILAMPDGGPQKSLYEQYMAISRRNRIILGVCGMALSLSGLLLTEYFQRKPRTTLEYDDGRQAYLPSVKRAP